MKKASPQTPNYGTDSLLPLGMTSPIPEFFLLPKPDIFTACCIQHNISISPMVWLPLFINLSVLTTTIWPLTILLLEFYQLSYWCKLATVKSFEDFLYFKCMGKKQSILSFPLLECSSWPVPGLVLDFLCALVKSKHLNPTKCVVESGLVLPPITEQNWEI